MEPTIPTGSLVYVNTKDTQVSEGDIVTFFLSNGTDEINVTHRVEKSQKKEL
jgi:hypothetical protein